MQLRKWRKGFKQSETLEGKEAKEEKTNVSSCSYLFNFGEGEIESGVHPLQDFIPTYKVSSIHHSYTACGHGNQDAGFKFSDCGLGSLFGIAVN